MGQTLRTWPFGYLCRALLEILNKWYPETVLHEEEKKSVAHSRTYRAHSLGIEDQ